MAIVILFGLLSSTVLNMFVVPSLYLRFGSVARCVRRETATTDALGAVSA
jgi:Cu/Ag efflux pump CusA